MKPYYVTTIFQGSGSARVPQRLFIELYQSLSLPSPEKVDAEIFVDQQEKRFHHKSILSLPRVLGDTQRDLYTIGSYTAITAAI
jgi:hypothetical protein